jgi:peptidoglycan LD-endopeptidase LytH
MDPHGHKRPLAHARQRGLKLAALAVGLGLVGFWFISALPEPGSPPPPLDSVLVPAPPPVDTARIADTASSPDTSGLTLPIAPETIDSAERAATTPVDSSAIPLPSVAVTGGGAYLIPVAGITADKLENTFTDARSEGRVHDAIDIMAPRGTPVVATNDGEIVKLHLSERGGISLYQRCLTGDTIYYYAHLDRYADGIVEGRMLHRGELVGYVGETGNVAPGNPHLHFAIWLVTDPKKYWDGENLNPFLLLR